MVSWLLAARFKGAKGGDTEQRWLELVKAILEVGHKLHGAGMMATWSPPGQIAWYRGMMRETARGRDARVSVCR
jgi:hypothetical protein